ncbi:restriction endonuclease subunit R [Oscillatoria sp. CS-180]|uniref:restriction endonuclease subunit R n=1 Tax=Oscillatoria sp. CS-180 TaxID=3021720 RepID=UPI00232EAEAA|nr:restriction endonuclease subunit R [Oscillatoria sp. CS-180]MDB9526928.1 restriction endonuclease subunit R [Oscillatoria sp. CS-180]
MIQAIPAPEVTLRTLKQILNLQAATDVSFFAEWQGGMEPISELAQQALARVKANYLDFLEDSPVLENSVKMVVLGPLLDLAGFYRRPFRITTETSIDIELEDAETIIRGRIEFLVLNESFWLVVIESKRSDFAVTRALPQTLAYMLGKPDPERPTFGFITNGTEFLFLRAQRQPTVQYATSKLFSLLNPGNELYQVLSILQRVAQSDSP